MSSRKNAIAFVEFEYDEEKPRRAGLYWILEHGMQDMPKYPDPCQIDAAGNVFLLGYDGPIPREIEEHILWGPELHRLTYQYLDGATPATYGSTG